MSQSGLATYSKILANSVDVGSVELKVGWAFLTSMKSLQALIN